MKKILVAVALTSLFSLASCSRDEVLNSQPLEEQAQVSQIKSINSPQDIQAFVSKVSSLSKINS